MVWLVDEEWRKYWRSNSFLAEIVFELAYSDWWLANISMVATIDDMTGGEGAPLNAFKWISNIIRYYLSVLKLFLDQWCPTVGFVSRFTGWWGTGLGRPLELCRPITREYMQLESIMAWRRSNTDCWLTRRSIIIRRRGSEAFWKQVATTVFEQATDR